MAKLRNHTKRRPATANEIAKAIMIDEAVFIEFLNKDKNFKKDTKHFKSYDEAVKWAKANFDKFNPDMIKYSE